MSQANNASGFAVVNIVSLALAASYFMPGQVTIADPPSSPPGFDWKLSMNEEFNGTKLNTNRWEMYGNPENKKQQCFHSLDNVEVKNGVAIILTDETQGYLPNGCGNIRTLDAS